MRADPVAILLVLAAYVLTLLATRLPGVPTFGGHETIAWLYLGHVTIVAGAIALVAGMRRSVSDALLISLAALFALPFTLPFTLGILGGDPGRVAAGPTVGRRVRRW